MHVELMVHDGHRLHQHIHMHTLPAVLLLDLSEAIAKRAKGEILFDWHIGPPFFLFAVPCGSWTQPGACNAASVAVHACKLIRTPSKICWRHGSSQATASVAKACKDLVHQQRDCRELPFQPAVSDKRNMFGCPDTAKQLDVHHVQSKDLIKLSAEVFSNVHVS